MSGNAAKLAYQLIPVPFTFTVISDSHFHPSMNTVPIPFSRVPVKFTNCIEDCRSCNTRNVVSVCVDTTALTVWNVDDLIPKIFHQTHQPPGVRGKRLAVQYLGYTRRRSCPVFNLCSLLYGQDAQEQRFVSLIIHQHVNRPGSFAGSILRYLHGISRWCYWRNNGAAEMDYVLR